MSAFKNFVLAREQDSRIRNPRRIFESRRNRERLTAQFMIAIQDWISTLVPKTIRSEIWCETVSRVVHLPQDFWAPQTLRTHPHFRAQSNWRCPSDLSRSVSNLSISISSGQPIPATQTHPPHHCHHHIVFTILPNRLSRQHPQTNQRKYGSRLRPRPGPLNPHLQRHRLEEMSSRHLNPNNVRRSTIPTTSPSSGCRFIRWRRPCPARRRCEER